jgi:hypothetical protein
MNVPIPSAGLSQYLAMPDSDSLPSADTISDALVVWTGRHRTAWPHRDERRLIDTYGEAAAVELVPIIRELEREFYESDARMTAPDLASMGDRAKARFRELYPELSEDALEALAFALGEATRRAVAAARPVRAARAPCSTTPQSTAPATALASEAR